MDSIISLIKDYQNVEIMDTDICARTYLVCNGEKKEVVVNICGSIFREFGCQTSTVIMK